MIPIKHVKNLQSKLDESVTIDPGGIIDVSDGDIAIFNGDETKEIMTSRKKISDFTTCDLGGYAYELVAIKTDNTRELKPTGYKVGTGTASGSKIWPSSVFGNAALKTITISTSDPSGGSDGDIWFKIAE